jgi:DNA-binding MarR family transcriptional regulator
MTVSKALKKLVAEGYVKRLEHKEDTRAKSVLLTEKGKELVSKLIPIVEKIDDGFFSVVKKTDRLSLINVLNKLVSNADISE